MSDPCEYELPKFLHKVEWRNSSDSIKNEHHPQHGLATIWEKPCFHKIMVRLGWILTSARSIGITDLNQMFTQGGRVE